MNVNTDNQEPELTYNLSCAKNRQQGFWHDNSYSQGKLSAKLLDHRPRPEKDTFAFVPAKLKNNRRRKGNVLSISLLVFDIDGGQTYEEVISFLRERGYYAFVYTTYSHLTSTTIVRCDHFQKWASENDRHSHPDDGAIAGYLADTGKDYITGPKIRATGVDHDGHECIEIEHDAIHKLRIVFPLKTPFIMATHGGEAAWTRTYATIGEALGLRIDPACSDPTRLFYWPSHPPATPEGDYGADFVEGAFLDFRDFEVGEDAPATAGTKQRKKSSKKRNTTAKVSGELIKFAKDCGRTFMIGTALQARSPSKVLSERRDGGFYIECPYEGDHTAPSPTRTYAVDGDGQSGFVIYCSGAHCQKDGRCRDRLEFLGKMLDDGWLDQSDLVDPALGGKPKSVPRTTFVWEKRPPLEQAKECCRALLDSNQNDPKVFLAGGKVKQLRIDNGTGRAAQSQVTKQEMRLILDRLTNWRRMPKDDDSQRRYIATPSDICNHVLQLIESELPQLFRICDAPFFDADGHLVADPGYHAGSRTYYAPPKNLSVTPPAMRPTAFEVTEAVKALQEPFQDFPFNDGGGKKGGKTSFAHVMAALLQPLVRQMISGPTPAYLIQKPSPGTGAGLLTDVISEIVFGVPAKIEVEKKDKEEWRKSITSSLLNGTAMIVFDNIHSEIRDASIAAAITSETWSDRLLGKSEKIEVPNTAMWFFTGNNVTFTPEIARRIVLVRLDTGLVDPTQERVFKNPDLKRWVRANRARLLTALLTIVQAWIAADRPLQPSRIRLPSFEDWSDVIGGILAHANIPGFLGDRETIKASISDEADDVQALIELMFKHIKFNPVRVGRLEWNATREVECEFSTETDTDLAHLVLNNDDQLTFRWLSLSKEKWAGRIGAELSQHVDRAFRIDEKTTVCLRKKRESTGVVYWLELQKPVDVAFNDSPLSNDDLDDAGEGDAREEGCEEAGDIRVTPPSKFDVGLPPHADH
jgi:hypothetical protein